MEVWVMGTTGGDGGKCSGRHMRRPTNQGESSYRPYLYESIKQKRRRKWNGDRPLNMRVMVMAF